MNNINLNEKLLSVRLTLTCRSNSVAFTFLKISNNKSCSPVVLRFMVPWLLYPRVMVVIFNLKYKSPKYYWSGKKNIIHQEDVLFLLINYRKFHKREIQKKQTKSSILKSNIFCWSLAHQVSRLYLLSSHC